MAIRVLSTIRFTRPVAVFRPYSSCCAFLRNTTDLAEPARFGASPDGLPEEWRVDLNPTSACGGVFSTDLGPSRPSSALFPAEGFRTWEKEKRSRPYASPTSRAQTLPKGSKDCATPPTQRDRPIGKRTQERDPTQPAATVELVALLYPPHSGLILPAFLARIILVGNELRLTWNSKSQFLFIGSKISAGEK
jgi:hypothetical protein